MISNAPQTWKRVKKAKKSIDSRIVVSRQFDFTRKFEGSISVAKNIEFIEEKRRNHRINDRIAINSQDCTSFGELTRLSHERLIGDGVSTVSHVVCFEETRHLIRPLGFNPTVAINRKSTNRD